MGDPIKARSLVIETALCWAAGARVQVLLCYRLDEQLSTGLP